jgi:hypothetical protein
MTQHSWCVKVPLVVAVLGLLVRGAETQSASTVELSAGQPSIELSQLFRSQSIRLPLTIRNLSDGPITLGESAIVVALTADDAVAGGSYLTLASSADATPLRSRNLPGRFGVDVGFTLPQRAYQLGAVPTANQRDAAALALLSAISMASSDKPANPPGREPDKSTFGTIDSKMEQKVDLVLPLPFTARPATRFVVIAPVIADASRLLSRYTIELIPQGGQADLKLTVSSVTPAPTDSASLRTGLKDTAAAAWKRRIYLNWLIETDPTVGRDAAIELVNDMASPSLQEAALENLGTWSMVGGDVAVRSALKSASDARVLASALKWALSLGDRSWAPLITPHLQSEDAQILRGAIDAARVWKIDEAGEPMIAVLKRSKVGAWNERQQIVKTLVDIGSANSFAILERTLLDKSISFDARASIALELDQNKNLDARGVLARAFANSEFQREFALNLIGRGTVMFRDLKPVLVQIVRDKRTSKADQDTACRFMTRWGRAEVPQECPKEYRR